MKNSGLGSILFQTTIAGDGFREYGIEAPGGNIYPVEIRPGLPNTGIVYVAHPDKRKINSDIRLAHFEKLSYLRNIYLENEVMKVYHVEHLGRSLREMGIDNAEIHLYHKLCDIKTQGNRRKPVYMVPNFPENELSIIKKVKQTGLKIQNVPRKFFRLNPHILSHKFKYTNPENQRFQEITVSPSDCFGIEIEAIVNYEKYSGKTKLSYCSKSLQTTSLEELYEHYKLFARSRSYANSELTSLPYKELTRILCNLNGEFGPYHGISEENFLYPAESLEEFRKNQEKANQDGKELKRHKIKDASSPIQIIEDTLGGRIIYTKLIFNQSGHEFELIPPKTMYRNNLFVPVRMSPYPVKTN